MDNMSGVLLKNHFINNLDVGGELAWFTREYNASTGYDWRFRPDNSGVYKEEEKIVLHPSTEAVGVPGEVAWKFSAVRKGSGSMYFELFPPGSEERVEAIKIDVEVK